MLRFRLTHHVFLLPLVAGAIAGLLLSCSDTQPSPSSSPNSPSAASSPVASSPPSSVPIPKPPDDGKKSELTKQIEKAAIDVLQGQITPPIQWLSCPNQETVEAGKVFDCDAAIKEGKFLATITLKDDKGNFNVKTKHLLVLPKVEQLLREGIKQNNQLEATADCGGQVRLFEKAGETFTCKVATKEGKTGTATITIEDEVGKVNAAWKF